MKLSFIAHFDKDMRGSGPNEIAAHRNIWLPGTVNFLSVSLLLHMLLHITTGKVHRIESHTTLPAAMLLSSSGQEL